MFPIPATPHFSQSLADARYLQLTGGTISGSLTVQTDLTLGKNGVDGTPGSLTMRDGLDPGSTYTLSYAELSYLDGQDQYVKTSSSPQFARLGLGMAAHATAGLATDGIVDLTNIANIADHSYYGDSLAAQTVDINAFGLFATLFMAADGHYDTATADATTHCPCVALAAETGTGSKKVIVKGLVRDDSWTWITGPGILSLIYLDPTTAGGMTQTLPSVGGQQVQILGWAVTSCVMYFNPNYGLVEV